MCFNFILISKSSGKWSELMFALVFDSMFSIEFLHLWLTNTKSICAYVLFIISSYPIFSVSLLILHYFILFVVSIWWLFLLLFCFFFPLFLFCFMFVDSFTTLGYRTATGELRAWCVPLRRLAANGPPSGPPSLLTGLLRASASAPAAAAVSSHARTAAAPPPRPRGGAADGTLSAGLSAFR